MGGSTSFPHVNINFRNDAMSFAAALGDLVNPGDGLTWMQYSPTSLIWRPVVEASVDDEFDTQRRRGTIATVRTAIAIT
jgi:hypothetical protein